MQSLNIGISPCPNDTFMFAAMAMGMVSIGDIELQFVFKDVEELNQMAQSGALDIVKMSYSNYFRTLDKYIMLRSGSALGNQCGPLIIARKPMWFSELADYKVAIPGENTTANLLLGMFAPEVKNKVPLLFSKIEKAILDGEVGAGVIIHESRFTYEDKGLIKIADLGEMWQLHTGTPIALGGIAIKRNLPTQLHKQIENIIKISIQFAFNKPKSIMEFVRKHAQSMKEKVIFQHIQTYVNAQSINIGDKGMEAVHLLNKKAIEAGYAQPHKFALFVQ